MSLIILNNNSNNPCIEFAITGKETSAELLKKIGSTSLNALHLSRCVLTEDLIEAIIDARNITHLTFEECTMSTEVYTFFAADSGKEKVRINQPILTKQSAESEEIEKETDTLEKELFTDDIEFLKVGDETASYHPKLMQLALEREPLSKELLKDLDGFLEEDLEKLLNDAKKTLDNLRKVTLPSLKNHQELCKSFTLSAEDLRPAKEFVEDTLTTIRDLDVYIEKLSKETVFSKKTALLKDISDLLESRKEREMVARQSIFPLLSRKIARSTFIPQADR